MLLKYSAVAATCMVLLSTGCAVLFNTPQLEPISTYNPITDAKINVYTNSDIFMYLFPNQTPDQTLVQSIWDPIINIKTAYKQANTHMIRYFSPYGGSALTIIQLELGNL